MNNTSSKLIAHIPARGGSKRCPDKNVRLIAGHPMISYAIRAAKEAGLFDQVIVNSDCDQILAVADKYGASAYLRSEKLANDEATGDDFTFDFISKNPCDTLVMINPVCPLIKPSTIIQAVRAFQQSACDTLITCNETQMQVFCEGKAVNIDSEVALRPSQENKHVQVLNWAVTIWNTKIFCEKYRKDRSGYLGQKRYLFPIDELESVKVSEEKDFIIAKLLIESFLGD